MYQLKKLKSLLLLLFVAVTAKAQLSDGKVYNFVNIGNAGKSMTSATAGNYLSIATTDESDYSQLWYCASDGNGFTLRNLGNGNYLRSPNAGGNTNWTLVKTVDGDNCRFSCTQESGHDVLRAINTTDSYHYMHYGATTGTVVCWTSSAPATQWDFTEVSGITSTQLNDNWEALATINPSDAVVATYQTALGNLFSDKACTTLKKSFANEDAVKNDADYKALPTTLQQMVLKVYGGDDAWREENYDTNKEDWDADYAKKYRVQLYEPYNEPEAAAAALGLNAHTNLNNPTGIFSGGREAMYVMVEGEIEEGASLYLASYSGHGKLGGYQNGVELKPGLNVVPSYFAGNNYCIIYVVHTFNTEGGTKKGNKAKARKLSDYADLKIHVEGGHINGYWNKMGDDLYTPDKNADWDYIAARATQTDVTVLGEYITLQFPLHDALNSDGGTEHGLDYYYTGKNIIESSIQEWDNVMMWERIVLGVLDETTTEDAAKNPKSPYAVARNVFAYIGNDTDGFESGYGDYYNVHGLSFGTPHGYMYGGWDHCGYHFNTMGAIMTSMITDAGSHWGPAHEIGHQHQGLLTVNGLTEVTNNLFSNVVLWYFGKTTSRVNGSALEPIAEMFANEEADFFNTTSNVFITTQMYYKLFLYYHVLGHNPKFYPKLFEMLRQDPMSTGYNQRGATSILHFYKKSCEAAGEDLTEFFRAYGFFRVMTNRLVGDYANSVYDQTQEDIDYAIAEVKAMAEENGWKQNIAVLFINDDTGGQILSHRSDTEYLTPFEGADSELGSYATYSDVTAPNYTYTIVGTTVTMEGEGGIGFAIFNEKGELIGFSDNKTFEVSVECAEAIASGKAEVKTMKGDNEAVEAVNIMDTDDTDAKRAMLGELVESAKAVLDLSDEDGTKVGFYRASYLEALDSAYTQAKQVYDDRTVASYSAVYNALFHEYFEVMNNAYARIGLVEGNAYRLTNKNYPNRSLSIPTDSVNKQMMGEITDTESPYDQQLWYFEASETEGSYYLKNKNTSTYPGNVETSTFIYATATSTSDAHAYKLRDMGNGLWALEGNTALHMGAANYKYGVLGWRADATASQWYITAVDVNENAEALFCLQGMVEKTKDLAGEMANVQYSGKLALQAVSESEPYYLSTNACHNTLNNASDGQGLAGLLDDDTETFFHSDYGGKISNTHYLQVDLGSGNTMSKFAFNYTTRSNGNNCPTAIEVAGSNSADGTFTPLQAYTAASDGLPNGNALSWESPVIENTGNYRYLRFSVTATENSKIYFVKSTFGITNHETVVKSIEEKYSTAGLTEQTLKNLGEKLFDANELMASDAATSASLQAMCSSIEESYYTPLLAIYNNANAARLTALKSELSTLISQTTTLIGQCGTVTVIPAELNGALSLQTTNPNGGLYLSTNAQESEERNIKYLIDSDDATFFHSAWSWDVEATHYLQVDLGEGKSLREFAFTYKTAASGPFPYTIKVYGSNEDNYDSFQKNHLATFSKDDAENPLPSSASKEWNSSSIYSTTAYRYLRFEVTNSGASGLNATPKGEYCFVMSYFGVTAIGAPESYTAELKPEAGDAGTDLLIETFKKNAEAQGVYTYATTELQVEAAIAKLQTQYDKLLAAQQSSDKATLRDLVARTTELIGECGTLSYAETPTKVNLQAENSTSNLYLSCSDLFYDINDNPGDSDTDCADLLDGNTDTYIHTNYNALSNTYPHYLQVAFGASEIPLQFKFSYRTRHNGANQVPKHIVVKGSNDEVNFDEILAEFDDESDGMPTTMNTSWTAPNDIIGYYKYLRFYVTESPQTNPYFAMSEFSMSYTGYAIKWNNAQHGTATNAQLIAAYEARNAANELLATTTTKEALQAATTALQEKYDELYNALNGIQVVDFTITTNIDGGGVQYKGQNYTESLSAPSTLTAEALTAMQVDGYVDESITINDTEISLIYNKVYTVTITGGEGEGRVTFGDDEYANDETFDALQNSFTAADLIATDVEGYTKSEVTVNHETGAISVTYTLDKSALNDLLGDTYTLIYACNGFVNSEFVTAALLEETNAAWTTAQNELETVQTRSELSDALDALQVAHDKLNAAKTLADAEATERTELNGQLSTLIAETKTFIASCYENDVLKYVHSEFVTEETISTVRTLIEAAEAKCSTSGTTATEYNASIDALTEAKSNLAAAIENAEEEAEQRVQLKADLQALVARTQSLMDNCGTVIFVEATETQTVDLQTTEPTGDGYLSANSTQSDEFSVAKLLDKDINTHFHSSWDVAATDHHHLQVYLGEGKSLAEFTFTYTTRNDGSTWTSPAPTVIEVYGSNDPISFTDLLGRFTKDEVDLPAYTEAGVSWTSPKIKPETSYEYIRFYVKESAGPGNAQFSRGYYFFAMSSFSLMSIGQPERYDVELTAPGVRGVTEEMLKEVYLKKIEANNLLEGETANCDLEEMIATLTTAYGELDEAYNTFVFDKSELGTLITQTRELIASCYEGETFKYTGSLYITEDLVETTTNKADEAQQVFEDNVNEEQYSVALAQLKEAYANLQYAIECALFPVLLTADPASPELYVIKTKRDGDNLVLQYDEPTELFSVTASVDKEPTQAFYFMKGDGSQVYIYPYMAGGKVLAANDVTNGDSKALAEEQGTATYEKWVFVARADGYYNLQPAGTSTYLSNIYGTSHKMGFYGSSPDTDKGSLFKFESTTVEGSYYYLKLKDYYENQAKVAGSNIQGGEAVGYYPTDKANAYNSAYSNATDVLASSTATDEEYTNAYDALKAANEALVLNMPVVGKYYVIRSAHTGYAANKLMYATGENAIRWDLNKTEVNPEAVWTFTSEGYLENLNTGCAVNTNGGEAKLGTAPKTISIKGIGEDGQVLLTPAGGTPLHADWHGHAVSWGTYVAGSASAWRIVEVEDMSQVKHSVSITQYEHAGLYLNYPVTIPDDVKAYYLDGSKISIDDNGIGTLKLTLIDGNILPARTAVILYAPHGEKTVAYDFVYTEEQTDEYENLFTGSTYQTYREAEANHYYYVFGQNNGEIGLYKNGVKYDATGAEGTTHYKMSANKILFDWDNNTTATMVKSFRFRLGTGGQTTSLEDALMMDNAIIYDLYGRRIPEVKTSGLYIINGEKHYIHVK